MDPMHEDVPDDILDIDPTELNSEFERELTRLINRYSLENQSDSPDFVLAQFMTDCLKAYNRANWHKKLWLRRY